MHKFSLKLSGRRSFLFCFACFFLFQDCLVAENPKIIFTKTLKNGEKLPIFEEIVECERGKLKKECLIESGLVTGNCPKDVLKVQEKKREILALSSYQEPLKVDLQKRGDIKAAIPCGERRAKDPILQRGVSFDDVYVEWIEIPEEPGTVIRSIPCDLPIKEASFANSFFRETKDSVVCEWLTEEEKEAEKELSIEEKKQDLYTVYLNNGAGDALTYFNNMKEHEDEVVFFFGTLLLSQLDLQCAEHVLNLLVGTSSPYALRSSWTLAKEYVKRNCLVAAENIIHREAELYYSLQGQELLGEIAVKEGDEAKALKIYKAIKNRSEKARNYMDCLKS